MGVSYALRRYVTTSQTNVRRSVFGGGMSATLRLVARGGDVRGREIDVDGRGEDWAAAAISKQVVFLGRAVELRPTVSPTQRSKADS